MVYPLISKETKEGSVIAMRGLLKERDLDLGFGKPRWGMRGGQEGKERCVYEIPFIRH